MGELRATDGAASVGEYYAATSACVPASRGIFTATYVVRDARVQFGLAGPHRATFRLEAFAWAAATEPGAEPVLASSNVEEHTVEYLLDRAAPVDQSGDVRVVLPLPERLHLVEVRMTVDTWDAEAAGAAADESPPAAELFRFSRSCGGSAGALGGADGFSLLCKPAISSVNAPSGPSLGTYTTAEGHELAYLRLGSLCAGTLTLEVLSCLMTRNAKSPLTALAPPTFDGASMRGGSTWYVGAVVNVSHCLTVVSPAVPAGADLGSMSPPFKIDTDIKHNCVDDGSGAFDDEWVYDFTITVEFQDATYVGKLLNLFASSVTFHVTGDSNTWHGSGDRETFEGCSLALGASFAEKMAEAKDWAADQLDAIGPVEVDGTLSYVLMADGSYLLEFPGSGKGTFSYSPPDGLNAIEAWEWSAAITLLSDPNKKVIAQGDGSSVLLSP